MVTVVYIKDSQGISEDGQSLRRTTIQLQWRSNSQNYIKNWKETKNQPI